MNDQQTINNNLQYIKQKIKNCRKRTQLQKLLNSDILIKSYFQNIMKNGFFKTIMQLKFFILKNLQYRKCPVCGKPLTFNQLKRNIQYCSIQCMTRSDLVQDHRKNTCIIRFGCQHQSQNQKIKEKTKNTCLQKYGSSSPLGNKEVREKSLITVKQKYGCQNVGQNDLIKQKIRHTNLQKYGNQVYVKSEQFKERCKNTCLEKYGYQNQFSSPIIQQKAKKSLLQRYGVENAFCMEKSKKRQKAVKAEQAFNTIQTWKDYIIPLFDISQWEGYSKQYLWKCGKCGNVFKQYLHKSDFLEISHHIPRCLKCYPYCNGFSFKQKQLANFCKQYFPNLKENVKNLIKPYQVDILIEQLKLCLQFNGSYFHSIQSIPPGYHLMKTQMCNQKGYRLIHIWQNQWNQQTRGRLVKIFQNKEQLKFNQPLDRSWFNNFDYPFKTLQPEVVQRDKFKVENCGEIIYIKK